MGCDIHAFFEVKQNGKWCYVPDLPDEFDDRNYGMFAMLNKRVRNSLGLNGFEGRGLPEDITGMRYRFRSLRGELEHGYRRKGTMCCFVDENTIYSVYDEKLTTIIDIEMFEHLMDGMTEEEKLRYCFPRHILVNHETEFALVDQYVVQDASVVGGKFMEVPFHVIYKDLKAYNDAYYKHEWVDEYQDFGYFEVDFNSKDYHNHSYLTLKDLLTKVKDISAEKTYQVPSGFIEELLNELGELPECFIFLNEDINAGVITVGYNEECDTMYVQKTYNQAVQKVQQIKKKYGIANDEDVRVVFAFDS